MSEAAKAPGRPLTPAEAGFIHAALAHPAEPESPRRAFAGLPRSTYHAIRARAVSKGWFQEAYVPNPAALGFGAVSFVLGRHFSDRGEGAVSQLRQVGGCTLLLQGSTSLQAVFFHKDREAAREAMGKIQGHDSYSNLFTLVCDTTPEAVPVYFDHEGTWAHLSGRPITSYPTPICWQSGARPASPREISVLRETLPLRSFTGGLLGLPRRVRRAIERGDVSMRVFLRPWALPPYHGRSLDTMIFAHGELKGGPSPGLLGALTAESRAYPFLFASDGASVLIGALGQSSPLQPQTIGRRRRVLDVLSEHLTGIETSMDPVGSLVPVREHSYEELLKPARPVTP